MARDKITIVGAGNVGATAAYIAATRLLGDIVLLDIVEGLAQGKALDIAQAIQTSSGEKQVHGTCNWQDTADSRLESRPSTTSLSR